VLSSDVINTILINITGRLP